MQGYAVIKDPADWTKHQEQLRCNLDTVLFLPLKKYVMRMLQEESMFAVVRSAPSCVATLDAWDEARIGSRTSSPTPMIHIDEEEITALLQSPMS